jgi:hypothetical protein
LLSVISLTISPTKIENHRQPAVDATCLPATFGSGSILLGKIVSAVPTQNRAWLKDPRYGATGREAKREPLELAITAVPNRMGRGASLARSARSALRGR